MSVMRGCMGGRWDHFRTAGPRVKRMPQQGTGTSLAAEWLLETKPMSGPNPSSAAAARDVLASLRVALDEATAALARRCSVDGRLASGALDAMQVPSFELAWAA